jgi:hypothetical protein
LEMYSTIGSAIRYGCHKYKETKRVFLDGSMLVLREETPKLISPTNAKELAGTVAEAMLSGFKFATKLITGDGGLTDNFYSVHEEMKNSMLNAVTEFIESQYFKHDLSGEDRITFVKEADLFLVKFAWMVLQHIQCFPSMQGCKEYIEQHMPNEKKATTTKNSGGNFNQQSNNYLIVILDMMMYPIPGNSSKVH